MHITSGKGITFGLFKSLGFVPRRQIKLANELFEIALTNIRNAIKVADDPRVIIFKQFDKTWLHFILQESEKARIVISPTHRKTWAIRCVPQRGNKFEYCKLLPAEWGGRQQGFAEISGVHDALYCHIGCFLAEAQTLEGARKLTVFALND